MGLPVFEVASSARVASGYGTTHSVSLTVPAGHNRIVFVVGCTNGAGAPTDITTTFGGLAPSGRVFFQTDGAFQGTVVEYWTNDRFGTGAITAALTRTGSTDAGGAAIAAVCLSNVRYPGVPLVLAAGTGSGTGVDFDTSAPGFAAGRLIVDFWGFFGGAAPVVGSVQTSRVNDNGAEAGVCVSTQDGASGGSMTWTWSGAEFAGGAVTVYGSSTPSIDSRAHPRQQVRDAAGPRYQLR